MAIPDYIKEYGELPSKASDYGFVLSGISKLSEEGTLCAILPHGVLFRAQKEGEIRKNLILKHMVYAVIGLPDGLFLNTQIPVSVIVFRKYSDNIFFADASREFKKEGKQNRLRQQDLDKIIGSFKHRLSTTKYSNVVDLKIVE